MEDNYIKGTKIVDHTGKVFGDLKVISFKEKLVKHPIWFVECLCCGREFTMQSTHLKNKVKGLGCGNGCTVRINKVEHLPSGISIVDVSTETFRDKYCILDTEDYFKFMTSNKWYAYRAPHSKVYYCYCKQENKRVSLHRLINNTPEDLLTDHEDGNGLNNRKDNLRSVTCSENQRNTALGVNNTSGYKGVNKRPNGKWCVSITKGVKEIEIVGTFTDLSDAIEARISKEIEYGYHENNGRIREKNI